MFGRLCLHKKCLVYPRWRHYSKYLLDGGAQSLPLAVVPKWWFYCGGFLPQKHQFV